MKSFFVFGVICLQLNWSYGIPVGVSSFAYQDSAGHRYGGTYQIPDGQFDQFYGPQDFPLQNLQIPFQQNYYQQQGDFFPDYFRNLQYLIQDITSTNRFPRFGDTSDSVEPPTARFGFLPPLPPLPPLKPLTPFQPLPPLPPLKPLTPFQPLPPLPPLKPLIPLGFRSLFGAFQSNLANQDLALKAAQKAFDLTSNQAGYIPIFPFRSGDFGNFDMFNSPNSAFAGGFAGPGFTHQIAAISPANPRMPNVNVMEKFNDPPIPGNKFVSMSSKAYSMSSNINGKEISNRGSETIVNNNGKVTQYSVKS